MFRQLTVLPYAAAFAHHRTDVTIVTDSMRSFVLILARLSEARFSPVETHTP